jgi:hypothetical protein
MEIHDLVESAKEIVSSSVFNEDQVSDFCEKVDLLLTQKLPVEAEGELRTLLSLYDQIISRALREKAGLKLKMKELRKRGDGLKAYLRPSNVSDRGFFFSKGKKT